MPWEDAVLQDFSGRNDSLRADPWKILGVHLWTLQGARTGVESRADTQPKEGIPLPMSMGLAD